MDEDRLEAITADAIRVVLAVDRFDLLTALNTIYTELSGASAKLEPIFDFLQTKGTISGKVSGESGNIKEYLDKALDVCGDLTQWLEMFP